MPASRYRPETRLVHAGTLRSQFGETFNFQFASEPGQSYEVEASTNLRDWESLMKFSASGTNVMISDPASIELPQRFYRLKLAE